MRKAALGMSVTIFAGMVLAACGNEPEPIAPVGPSFDRATESTDTDVSDPIMPGPNVPEAETVPPMGSEPGEIPEVMESEPIPGTLEGDTTTETVTDPALPGEDLSGESGAPQ